MTLSRWLDFLYPPSCHLCRAPLRDGRYLCADCRDDLPRITSPLCRRCGLPSDGSQPDPAACPNCHGRDFAFAFARAACPARDGARELVHAFKYERRLHLHRELACLTAEAFADERLAARDDWLLVPVPLHWRRRQWRWFNQAGEIARGLGRLRGLPVHHALRRTRFTTQQTLLSRGDRLRNLRGAFRLSTREMRRRTVEGRAILLVDDVFTTGSTADECSRVLREDGGAEMVVVLTAMRG